MRRRVFLAGAAVMGLAGARLTGKNIAVIGAGMAGLSAAQALAAKGASPTLYEARRRIGGRVYTSDLWPDLPCDLGASWIHGPKGNPLTAVARAAGAKMVATRYDSAQVYGDDPIGDLWDLIEDAAPRGTDLSLKDALLDLPKAQKLPQGPLRYAIHRAVEHEYGGDWGDLSARWFDRGTGFGGQDVLFPNGYSALVRHAAAGFKINTGAQVRRITARAGGVEIGFSGGGTIRADAAVVTLPLGVLQSGSVAFDPPLAPARQKAIDALGMGLLNKTFLRFDAVPDVPGVDWLEKLAPPGDVFPEWVNLAHVLGAPALLGFNAAASADDIETWSDADTIAAATQALRDMFGSAFPAPIDAQITRWRADPLALGSYSFHKLGAPKTARADLFGADWDGLIAFAGEACSEDHPSTAHGAWMTGADAAQELDI